MKKPPLSMDGFKVLEYGFLPAGVWPSGYVPPSDGGPALEPMQNFALCEAGGVNGFYLLCCTADWRSMTYCFGEDIEDLKSRILVEFGSTVGSWYAMNSSGPSSISALPT